MAMMTVPDDLIGCISRSSVVLPQGTIIDYQSRVDLVAQPVLMTRPTLVLVRSGIKKFTSAPSAETRLAPAGSLIAFRSGSHLMSEFRAEDDSYQSFVISFERSFLKLAIGMPSEFTKEPPRSRVAANLSSDQWEQLHKMPATIETLRSETEKEFRLREFIVLAMSDPVIRQMFYHEVADWGASIEHRISTVLNAHSISPLRVADLALLCGMSLASFKRYFQDIFNTSPGDWLHRTRLEHAYRLAARNEMSTREICAASGYKDVSSFIRAFSQRFGKTPRAIARGQPAK